MERAAQLHTDGFQLINPLGGALSKEQYLGGISSGQIHYLYWEPETIAVRVYGDAAVIRYQSELEIVVQGRHIPRQRYWDTDLYSGKVGTGEWCGHMQQRPIPEERASRVAHRLQAHAAGGRFDAKERRIVRRLRSRGG